MKKTCMLSLLLTITINLFTIPQKNDGEHCDIELVANTSSTADHYYRYLIATYQHARGNVNQSMSAFHQLFKTKPSSHACYDYLHLLFNTGQHSKIIALYNQKKDAFDKAFSSNVGMQLIFAQAFLSTNNEKQADTIFSNLVEKNPDDPQVAYFAILAHLKNNQLSKAADLINRCLKNSALKQKHFLFYFLQSKVFIEQKKLPQALKSIEQSLTLFPRFDRGWLFKAMLLEQMGRINDAITGYKQFLDLVGRDAMVEKQLTQLLFEQQRAAEAHEFLKHIHTNSPEYYFEQAVSALAQQRYDEALQYVDKTLDLAPDFTKARLLKVEILLQCKKTDQLMTFMQSWIASNYDDISVFHTLLLLRKAHVNTAAIIKLLQNLESTHKHVFIFASLADLFLESKNYPQAVAYYHKVLTSTADDKVAAKARFHIGYVYFVAHQTKNLEKSLSEAISQTNVYPSTYNLLAYHYASSNKQLPKALDYIEKALAMAPDCHYYIDTKGYILHKQGRTQEAIVQFKQALQLAPQDPVIQEHLTAAQNNLGK